MSKLFPNHIINPINGVVYSKKHEKNVGECVCRGYRKCNIKDIYGNKYQWMHEVIIAEGLQLPKHLWPIDEDGKRYIVDHIIPVSNGGTDAFENLHLVPKPDNNRNPISRQNLSKAKIKNWQNKEYRENFIKKMKGRLINRSDMSIPVLQRDYEGNIINTYPSVSEAARNGFNKGHIAACCRGEEKTHKGFIWSFN